MGVYLYCYILLVKLNEVMPYLTRWSMLSINCLIALRKGNIWNVFLTGKYIVRLQNPTSSTTYWYSLYLVSHGRIQEPHWFHKLLQWEWSCGGKKLQDGITRFDSPVVLVIGSPYQITSTPKTGQILTYTPNPVFRVYTHSSGSFQDQVSPKTTWTLELHL